jgi:hypothetical protein
MMEPFLSVRDLSRPIVLSEDWHSAATGSIGGIGGSKKCLIDGKTRIDA